MQTIEIKFSKFGVTPSSTCQRQVLYMIVANITDNKGKRHRYYLDTPFISDKKQLKTLLGCETHFIILVDNEYFVFNEVGERISSFPVEKGNAVYIDSQFIALRTSNEISFYTHRLVFDHKRELTPEEIEMLDSKD